MLKRLIVFLLLLLSICGVQAQVLESALNLNAGGVIYDVEKIGSDYIVVGDFSSINGLPRNNMAVIDSATMTVTGLAPINFINGAIHTVEYLNYGITTYILIGGDFTVVNGQSRNQMAVLTRSFPSPFYSVYSWHMDITDFYSREIVIDFEMKGDTLLVGGNFYSVNDAMGGDVRENFAAYKVTYSSPTLSFSLLNYGSTVYTNAFNSNIWFGTTYYQSVTDISVVGGDVFLSGTRSNQVKLNAAGNIDPLYAPTFATIDVMRAEAFGDSLLISTVRSGSGTELLVSGKNQTNGSAVIPTSGSFISGGEKQAIAQYKNKDLFIVDRFGLQRFDAYSGTQLWAVTTNNNTHEWIIDKQLFMVDNRLFMSTGDLTTIDGQTRNGLAVYCLEPHDAINITVSENTICAGDNNVTLTTIGAKYATEYLWTYSGTGATISGSGTPLNGTAYIGVDTIAVDFDVNATSGIFSVTPRSHCGLTANTVTENVFINPIPNLSIVPPDSINCIVDSVLLVAQSTTPGVAYEWPDPLSAGTFFTTDSIYGFVDSAYMVEITSPFGCTNRDTVRVIIDTVLPTINPLPQNLILTCTNPTIVLNGSTINPSDSLYWTIGVSGSDTANPFTIDVATNYYLHAIDQNNGCRNSTNTLVESNVFAPNIYVLEQPTIPGLILNTITCDTSSYDYTITSDTANTVAYWTSPDTSANYGDVFTFISGGFFDAVATDTSNGCSNYYQVFIAIDTASPNTILPPATNINCSSDSVTLNGSSGVVWATIEWNGPGLVSAPNPITVINQGWYSLLVTDTTNGCIAIDSVEVSYIPEITVDLQNDTLVCDGADVPLAANYIGNATLSGITFNWSNGLTDSVASYTGGTDTIAILEIFGSNSCYGTDTVRIATPEVPTANIATFKPCGQDENGQITLTMIGGLPPFTFSIDTGQTFQAAPLFTDLAIGNYLLLVSDSLGCYYDYTASIDDSSAVQTPQFLVSTYSTGGDTLVCVDVSIPQTDSSTWSFPPGVIVIDNNPVSPMIILPDTGEYVITMNGYYGPCLFSSSQTVYSELFDSTAASPVNDNGLKSILLYPNPNTGSFTAEVEFFKKQQVVLLVQDMLGNTYHYTQYGDTDLVIENISLGTNATNGTYIFKVIGEYDSGYVQFVISR